MKCWDKIKSWFGGDTAEAETKKPVAKVTPAAPPKKAKEPVAKVAPPSEPVETESTDTPK